MSPASGISRENLLAAMEAIRDKAMYVPGCVRHVVHPGQYADAARVWRETPDEAEGVYYATCANCGLLLDLVSMIRYEQDSCLNRSLCRMNKNP